MSFDINKPYRCRDGRGAWATAVPSPQCNGLHFIGIAGESHTAGVVIWWNSAGRSWSANGPQPSDLVNFPEKRTVKVWINVRDRSHPSDAFKTYVSRGEADHLAPLDRTACIEREITYTVGEGL